jgi:hypothetical protein
MRHGTVSRQDGLPAGQRARPRDHRDVFDGPHGDQQLAGSRTIRITGSRSSWRIRAGAQVVAPLRATLRGLPLPRGASLVGLHRLRHVDAALFRTSTATVNRDDPPGGRRPAATGGSAYWLGSTWRGQAPAARRSRPATQARAYETAYPGLDVTVERAGTAHARCDGTPCGLADGAPARWS